MVEPSKTGAPLVVDLLAVDDADEQIAVLSANSWTVERDGGRPEPVKLCSRQDGVGAAWSLYYRPHPLPATAWLSGPQPEVVLDLPPLPPLETPQLQRLSWTIPPGARAMSVKLIGASDVRLEVDSQTMDVPSSGQIVLSDARWAPAARC